MITGLIVDYFTENEATLNKSRILQSVISSAALLIWEVCGAEQNFTLTDKSEQSATSGTEWIFITTLVIWNELLL